MNGTERREIRSSNRLLIPANIAVDPLTGYVYWVDVDGDRRHIVMYDGVTDRPVVSNGGE